MSEEREPQSTEEGLLTQDEAIEKATKKLLETGEPSYFPVGRWESQNLIPKLNPISSLGGLGPQPEYPNSIGSGHVHFEEPPAKLSDEEKRSWPHKATIVTLPTEYSGQGVFAHIVDYGQDRMMFVVGYKDMELMEIATFN